jgi:hypothetical protein
VACSGATFTFLTLFDATVFISELLGRSSGGGRDGQGMWHVWGGDKIVRGFAGENEKREAAWNT